MDEEQKALVLIVCGQARELRSLTEALAAGGFAVEGAAGGKEAEGLFADHRHALVVIDLASAEGALDLIRTLRSADALLPVIVLAERGDSKGIAQAIERGASDCLARPFQLQKLVSRVAQWIERRGALVQPVPIDGGLREEPGFRKIVGSSDKIKDVFESIRIVTASDVPVLIQGETGTGKELVARAIHYRGPRRRFPFFPVNCAAIPETLLESELFGHERGAFTGAVERRKGKFEMAHGGTLFLDEIGEMPLSLQVKILRVIEDHTFRRVGGNELLHSDVRIISATNKDLAEEVRKGNFRDDLYYRLSVFPIYLPPLRERKNDIPELVEYFLQRAAAETGQPPKRVSPAAMELLRNAPWPGNVRELQNVLKRAALLAPGEVIEPQHLAVPGAQGPRPPTALEDIEEVLSSLQKGQILPLAKIEEVFIRQAIKITGGNITEAANCLGVSRSTIYRKMEEYGLHSS